MAIPKPQTSCLGFVCFIEWSILIRKLKDSRKLYNDPQSKTKKTKDGPFYEANFVFWFCCIGFLGADRLLPLLSYVFPVAMSAQE